jgi:hypothetical protein
MKNTILISCPIDSKSGYGYHSRDIVKSLFNLYRDKYEITIYMVRWGNTPDGALDINIKEDKEILDNIITSPLNKQPEIFINISVPNEFQPVGKHLNIGITAGIETTMASKEWIDGCNRMDLIIVPSEHSKSAFMNSVWETRDANTNTLIDTVRLSKQIEIIFEGINTKIFNTEKTNFIELPDVNKIDNDFLFLACGHWLPGDIGEDRKDMGGLIKTFLETFKNTDNPPALLLKVSAGSYSIIDYYGIKKKIDFIVKKINSTNLPDIYILHGDLSDAELNSLYNHDKVKVLLNFSKGEGYCRPLAEFSVTGKPIIASKWSGHLDFLSSKHCTLLNGVIKPVHPSVVWDKVIIQESSWFTVDYVQAKNTLIDIYANYDKYATNAKQQANIIKNFTLEKMEIKLKNVLDAYLQKVPVTMELKLPTLKKI